MSEWITVCSPKMFDLVGAFEELDEIDFKQSTNVQVGDGVYFYVSDPIREIRFKCKVTRVDLVEKEIDSIKYEIDDTNYANTGRYMRVKLIEKYSNVYRYDELVVNGLNQVQGPSLVTEQLKGYLESQRYSMNEINYFFVHQNENYLDESTREYLWAPKRNSKGNLIHHWSSLVKAKKGDLIIHSHKARIYAFSRVKEDCYTYLKPDGKGGTIEGWRVDSEYFKVDNPIYSGNHRDEYLKFPIKRYSPFDKNGDGIKGYFFVANKGLFDYILDQTLLKMSSNIKKDTLKYFCTKTPEVSPMEIELDQEMNEDVNELVSRDPTPKEYIAKPVAKPTPVPSGNKMVYPRNKSVAVNALLLAEGKCEIDPSHITFKRKKGSLPYTEPHHLIPMAMQGILNTSIDVEANIVSLCSHCHNKIHYGFDAEELIKDLYLKRKDEIEKIGVKLTLEELLKMYFTNK